MITARFFVVVSFLLVSHLSLANDSVTVFDAVSPLGPLSVHISQGENGWTVQAFAIDDDGLPKVVKPQRLVFGSREKALEFARAQFGVRDENINPEAFDTPLSVELQSALPTFGVAGSDHILWKAESTWSLDMEKK